MLSWGSCFLARTDFPIYFVGEGNWGLCFFMPLLGLTLLWIGQAPLTSVGLCSFTAAKVMSCYYSNQQCCVLASYITCIQCMHLLLDSEDHYTGVGKADSVFMHSFIIWMIWPIRLCLFFNMRATVLSLPSNNAECHWFWAVLVSTNPSQL